MEKIGVMVCGHGSRDAAAIAEFTALAEALKDRFPWPSTLLNTLLEE